MLNPMYVFFLVMPLIKGVIFVWTKPLVKFTYLVVFFFAKHIFPFILNPFSSPSQLSLERSLSHVLVLELMLAHIYMPM